jgi:aspartate/methionine/tyrosine aminotransferase
MLREQIVLDYDSRTMIADQTALSADNVLCFAGGEEAIYCAFKALLSTADDHCVVVTPCYQSLKSLPESLCSVTCIDLLSDDGWALDVRRIERAMISGRTKLIVVNFPHNPTGCIISAEQQAALIAVARAYGAWIFCDEIYRGVERNPVDAVDPIALRYERGISLGGMSKVYGMAGLRVGE